ncbi:low molecular weight protein arginine phosphatase [Alkalibacter mobilis]|uniref:low molecular weight protein arginine phosphatase n=1 Tax=Alkalibacter mobilis TaxID=2787712 RepID=UPI00189ECAE4|nr:low molecular weight protein arginine phosphatase [Alkalibacter mobilis]MBF7096165.1 low molecular weight protein arginine phosphatase [Alkalibacter mobilis]
MKRILLVCTGNTCRSSMAKGIFEQIIEKEGLKDQISIDSAGTSVYYSEGANPKAIEAVGEMGIDISGHVSKQIDEKLIADADMVLTMTRTQKSHLHHLFPGYAFKITTIKEQAEENFYIDISDPFGSGLSTYRKTAYELQKTIKTLVENKKI